MAHSRFIKLRIMGTDARQTRRQKPAPNSLGVYGRGFVWLAVTVTLAWQCGVETNAQFTLGPLTLSADAWAAMHAVAAADIVATAAVATVDCGVALRTRQSRDPLPDPAMVIALDSALGRLLNPVVYTLRDAQAACYTVAACSRVDLYTLPGTAARYAVYYRDPAFPDVLNLTRSNGGDGTQAQTPGPPPPPQNTWVAAATVDRTDTYWCPGGLEPDPAFLFDTYLATDGPAGAAGVPVAASGLLPEAVALGLPSGSRSGALAAPGVGLTGAAARALATAWATTGHKARVWPNARCALSPVARSPDTGCARSTCPLSTLCPPGFRIQVTQWGSACFPSAQGDPAGELVTALVTDFNPATGALVLASGHTLNVFTTADVAAVATQTTAVPPCSGNGICVHGASPGAAAACVCDRRPWGGKGVAGDMGCSLTPEACLAPGAGANDAACSGHGTCTHTRATVDWGAIDLTATEAGAVACVCTPPYTGPLCAVTHCLSEAGPDCGPGVCTLHTDSVPERWACVCPRPYFGPGCSVRDGPQGAVVAWGGAVDSGPALRAMAALGAASFSVWTTARAVVLSSDVASQPGDTPLLCGGRGVAVPVPAGGLPAGTCVCDPGWTGPRCEWAVCDHTACAPFGRCVLDVDAAGRAVTRCACAVAAADPELRLAWGPPHAPDTCTVTACGAGTLVITMGSLESSAAAGYIPPNVTNIVPRGTCQCAASLWVSGAVVPTHDPEDGGAVVQVSGVDPSGTSRVVLVGAEAAAAAAAAFGTVSANDDADATDSSSGPPLVLGFTPVLVPDTDIVLGYTSYAFVPHVVATNTGLRCDVPGCPVLLDPATNASVAGGTPCGVDPEAVDAVCVPCWPTSDSGSNSSFEVDTSGATRVTTACALSGGTGGWCDCEGTLAAAAGLALPWLPPGTGTAWSTNTNPRLPLCVPRCRNGGVWVPAAGGGAGACDCTSTTFWGPTCTTPRCRVGTSGRLPGPNCTTCTAGSGWNPDTACTSCAPGYTGTGCTSCAPGYWRAQSGACTACAATAAITCASPGVLGFTCSVSGPVCVCAPGYTGGGGGACTACAPGFGRPPNSPTVCVRCATLAGCNSTWTAVATCGPPATCTCKIPGMNPTCSACGAGHRLVNGVCVPCALALGCDPWGTLSARCPTSTPSSRDVCVCNTSAGASGLRCAACAPGWVKLSSISSFTDDDADDDAVVAATDPCISCAQVANATGAEPCGPFGALNCTNPTAPTCECRFGWSGPTCAACTGCGPGGTCSSNATGPPCVCASGFEAEPRPQAQGPGACTRCTQGWLNDAGTACTNVATACGSGPGVAVAASVAASACVCWPGWTGPTCSDCETWAAGPACSPCPGGATAPAAVNGAVCVWDIAAQTPGWECATGYTGVNCTACAPGWAAAGANENEVAATPLVCEPCPECGLGGTCVQGPACVCAPGYTQTGPDQPCDTCAEGQAVQAEDGTCAPCPPCAPGRVCVPTGGTPAGTGSCVCQGGLRVLAGTRGDDPEVACFTPELAAALEAHVRDPVALNALGFVGAPGVPPLPSPAVYISPTDSSTDTPWGFIALVAATTLIAAGVVVAQARGRRQ